MPVSIAIRFGALRNLFALCAWRSPERWASDDRAGVALVVLALPRARLGQRQGLEPVAIEPTWTLSTRAVRAPARHALNQHSVL